MGFLKNIKWAAVVAVVFIVALSVTLVVPNVDNEVVLALGFGGLTAAILALGE